MPQEVKPRLRRVAIGLALVCAADTPAAAQGAPDWYYGGSGSIQVRHLLTQVGGWSRPTCRDCPDGVTPQLKVRQPSEREMYVIEAIMRAWAAESYALIGDREMAAWNAQLVRFDLENATALCARPAEGAPGGLSGLDRIWGCPVPSLPFDTTLSTLPLAERLRRAAEAAERRGVPMSSARDSIKKTVEEVLEFAEKSMRKDLYMDASELIGQAVESLASGWTGATVASQLPDLIRAAREKLADVKLACAGAQQFARGRNAPIPKCP